jgi:alginate O-acetyltransferase complex protein AlgI
VMVSWVFFRCASLPEAWSFLGAMVGMSPASGVEHPFGLYADAQTLLAIAVGIVASTPVLASIKSWRDGLSFRGSEVGAGVIEATGQTLILLTSVMLLAAGTYNPFIYFRF